MKRLDARVVDPGAILASAGQAFFHRVEDNVVYPIDLVLGDSKQLIQAPLILQKRFAFMPRDD